MVNHEVWRVSPDGVIRDTFKKISCHFNFSEEEFFRIYASQKYDFKEDYVNSCQLVSNEIRSILPEFPLSNIWIASQMAHMLPTNSVIHFGILNSLRSWNFFDLPEKVTSYCNVGGFGIDGCMSTAFGAALCDPSKLYFCVIGDLAFFYDMNSIGNRHLTNNLRILLINNGKGTEFRQYGHIASSFGDDADKYISASGHFGQKSPTLVRHYAENLGFEYISAATKEEFTAHLGKFVDPAISARPMIFEVFTDSYDESKALEMIMGVYVDSAMKNKEAIRDLGRKVLGEKGTAFAKKILGK